VDDCKPLADGEQMLIASATGCNLLLIKLSFTILVIDWMEVMVGPMKNSNYAARTPLPKETGGLSVKFRNSEPSTDTRPTGFSAFSSN
jgi:hypothetical protein